MVVLAHFSTPSQTELNGKITENKNNKIPQYAREHKNEYLFVIGINGECGKFLNLIDEEREDSFDNSKATNLMAFFKKFLKAQEIGYLKDTTEFYFKECDTNYIDQLETTVADYFGFCYYDADSFQFSQERYDTVYPGLREFHECFERFKEKINIKEKTYEELMSEVKALKIDWSSDSDSDSVSDSGSDDFETIILSDIDIDSDSDSDSD